MPPHLIPSAATLRAIEPGCPQRRPSDGAGLDLRLLVSGGSHGWRLAQIDFNDLVHTIYHELTHKVIGTNDHEYGGPASKTLIADGRALKNADSYDFVLMSVD